MQEVLDALLELHDFEKDGSFPQEYEENYLSIVNAMCVNEELQNQVIKQIETVDKMLEANQTLMKEASHCAVKENRFGQKFTIHQVYDDNISYFDKSELIDQEEEEDEDYNDHLVDLQSQGEEEDEEEQRDYVSNQSPLHRKAWSKHERDRLIEAIHSEAKRMISFDYMKKNEAWRIWEVDQIEKKQLELFPVSRIDWERISSIHVRTRTPTECLIQWTTQEHPSINKKPWTKQESERLSQLVDQMGLLSGQWERIANELGTNRTISQCFSHYMAAKNNANARSLKWNPEEDRKLAEAVKIFGGACNWQQIASILGGRTGQQCLHRWTKTLNPAIRRTRWTPEENELLERAVKLYGVGNWTKVQRLIPGRTDMQCRERWVNNCHPTLKSEPATQEEIELIVKLVQEHGTKWSLIARSLPGRTDNFALRAYNQWLKKQNNDEPKRARKSKETTTPKKRGRKPNPTTPKKSRKQSTLNQEKEEATISSRPRRKTAKYA
ncbi:uncharacterized protein B0P05DRAFT_547880 [Gilbertella persicaria]|uniref:uncharacterized protein n=1 Tax=Gilbertella persicaria TaxID=101096 RepID=UPI00221EB634|nr:uncharacterized protein B0P05DRAFT_547880 [Gilbertella persicaria]KAI8074258.1 hypothetical protein B0P05DRAFT_547880 [Gilbertella persicaria]